MNAPDLHREQPPPMFRSLRAGATLAAGLFAAAAVAAPVSTEELATLCANAEDSAHCGRLVETEQMKRLPHLATRDGLDLKVSLYPSGAVTFTDVEAPVGGRSHSLWDYIGAINAVLLYTTVGDDVTFTLLQRANGRKVELPAEPKVAPDRQHLVTADFCATRCVNELAVWRISSDGVARILFWKPAEAWTDAVATWKSADTIRVDYTPVGAAAPKSLDRRLAAPDWSRAPAR
ncbi:MAG: hypothetical protein IPG28_01360 [Betaproteobacteria bacterium]|jgi:hypothetical protein|nr:hypothetical protein [Betaproteobacteria bacterium]MBK7080705.1 hypothetical protein [Betaproteobacteria bacterium]MBK7590909.1 hypothetical protein [Betaproteobacteria bacterium]MBK7742405.1 hypothetical protein [Betaproteobacteria bacterium]MBK8690424.1 hypothetical protein [Betaproteobacteria bacterium]